MSKSSRFPSFHGTQKIVRFYLSRPSLPINHVTRDGRAPRAGCLSLSLSPSIRGNRFVVSIGFKNRLVEAIVVRNRIIPRDGITSKISPLFLFFSRPNTLLRRPFISIFRESVHINRKRKTKLVSKKPRIHPGNTACTTDKRGIQRGEGGGMALVTALERIRAST